MNATEDGELRDWLTWTSHHGDGFLRPLAQAALMADDQEYTFLRPCLLRIKGKHPVEGIEP